ncbi:unnamed protein product [Chironomus riparius]|uniref:Luciferin 4-monooxygenase n=1 Tax=Chironomus riparius TaxID=315576 RepID=A0A9N9RXR9_9DIPT|nr:unnamed protein product [Chironomus riparius]
MAKYDPRTKILSSERLPQMYDPKISVGQVILNVMFKAPNKVIQVSDDDGIEVTCSQMSDMMTNIAKNLFKIGLRSGDVAGILASNTTYLSPAIFACLLLRLPMNPIEKSFDVNQIVNIFRGTRPKVVFCDHDVIEKLMAALGILEIEARIVILTDRIEGLFHISDFLQQNYGYDEFIYKVDSSVQTSLIVCTSGTSGHPKLALISHLQQLNVFIRTHNVDGVSFNVCSMYWAMGINYLIYKTLNAQKRLITKKRFTPDLFFDMVEKYRVTETFLVPPHLMLLAESPKFQTANLNSLNYVFTGGLCVSENIRRKINEKLLYGTVSVIYGTTEFCVLISETLTDRPISSSVGIPTINTEVKIQLDDGTTGGVKEIGEILARNTIRPLGYFKNSPRIKIDDDGWLHTGDMGFIDENYEINIIGQRTFVIRNYYNEIYPCEIENKIEALTGIARVCVVGLPDPIEIEIPAALIVRETNSNIVESVIIEVTNDLPSYKQLRGGIFFIDALPLTPSGKVKRKEAKEIATRLKIERESRMHT